MLHLFKQGARRLLGPSLSKQIKKLIGRLPSGEVALPFPSRGERLVFVGGAPRSGTTLTQLILDSHPDVFAGPEFDWIPAIVQNWLQVVGALERGRIAVFCSREQIDASFATLIESLLLPAADAAGARLLSEKTPFNVLVMSELLQLFEQCRAIHVVRDPRAVISSMLEVGKRCLAKNEPAPAFTTDIATAIPCTLDCLNAGFRAKYAFPDRVLTLVYETLVAQPEKTVATLCKFLQIPFDARMLEPCAKEHPGLDAIVQADNGTWVDPSLGIRPIELSRVDAWQRLLRTDQVDQINNTFRQHQDLRALGYEFAVEREVSKFLIH